MEEVTHELLIRYLLKGTTETEEAAVVRWLSADPANARELRELQWVWESSKKLEQRTGSDPDKAYLRFRNRLAASERKGMTKSLWNSPFIKAAAAVLLLLGVAAVIVLNLPHYGRAYYSTVQLQSGNQIVKEQLLDGTQVILNKHSQLSYTNRLFSASRKVELVSGEVFFDVAHKPDQPFVITSGDLAIRVLGTAFHVKKHSDTQQVILERGSVELSAGQARVTLSPGEMGVFDRKNSDLTVTQPDNSLYRYYINNRFEADNLPLGALLDALAEAYQVSILVQDQALRAKTVTTTLIFGSLEQNLEVLRETFGFRITENEGIILIE